MLSKPVYVPRYETSWALIIGINAYRHCPQLGYAGNDARAVARVLSCNLGFPAEKITLLEDEDAARSNIISSFLAFANGERVKPDDRVIMFFAGHGHTIVGHRGEVGFLVPVDGCVDNPATLIRWDELTRNADLIPAKHVLFIMDACYGGLAIPRYVRPGSMRFLRDMLRRYARQVLTAGKADEIVSDAGGPRPSHSVFTGHLLDALEGAAADSNAVLTANGVMAYVYDRVAKDAHSRQTPHYGHIEGDGDLIFTPAIDEVSGGDEKADQDTFVSVSADLSEQPADAVPHDPIDALKGYLSEPKSRIKLDDFVSGQVREVLTKLGSEHFPVQGGSTDAIAEFAGRLHRYEQAVAPLQKTVALLAKWARPEQQNILARIFARLAELNETRSGLVLWLGLRWYPLMLLMYTAGIAALSVENYESLSSVLAVPLDTPQRNTESPAAIIAIVDGMLEVERTDVFKRLPGHERQYVPRSEYVFKVLQPSVEDTLFLGRSYERLFDRLEVLLTLVYADITEGSWGPVGRFAWKYRSRGPHGNPYAELRAEVDRLKGNWRGFGAGFFRGSHERFDKVAEAFEQQLQRLQWF